MWRETFYWIEGKREEVVEIHSHGSRAAVAAILRFFEALRRALKSFADGKGAWESLQVSAEETAVAESSRQPEDGLEAENEDGVVSRAGGSALSDAFRYQETSPGGTGGNTSLHSDISAARRALLLQALEVSVKGSAGAERNAQKEARTEGDSQERPHEKHEEENQTEEEDEFHSGGVVSEIRPGRRGTKTQSESASELAQEAESEMLTRRREAEAARWLREVGELRLAEAGEFTFRAYLNGKIETVQQVEALADLVNADTVAQHRLAVRRLRRQPREVHALLDNWRGLLQEALAFSEAALEIGDDAQEADAEAAQEAGATKAEARVRRLLREIRLHLELGLREALVHSGVKVVFCGPTNAGKSTLFNSLVGRDAAIVSPLAGTTRDVLTWPVQLRGAKLLLTDTAGLRPAPRGSGEQRRAPETAAVAGDGAEASLSGGGSTRLDCMRPLEVPWVAPAGEAGGGRTRERDGAPPKGEDALEEDKSTSTRTDGLDLAVDCVEREGMARTVRTAQEADILIFLLECRSTREATLEHARRFLRIFRDSFAGRWEDGGGATPRERRVVVVLNKADVYAPLLVNQDEVVSQRRRPGDLNSPSEPSDPGPGAQSRRVGGVSSAHSRGEKNRLEFGTRFGASSPSSASPSVPSSRSPPCPSSCDPQLSSEVFADLLEELEEVVKAEMPPALVPFLQTVDSAAPGVSHASGGGVRLSFEGQKCRLIAEDLPRTPPSEAKSRPHVLLLASKFKWNLPALQTIVCRAVKELSSPEAVLRCGRFSAEKRCATHGQMRSSATASEQENRVSAGNTHEENSGELEGDNEMGLLSGRRVLEALDGLARHLENFLSREAEEERNEDLR
ncbi:tRNA modification GTPase TrmE, related [Neospora caninum Liverpool]|uniref:tRNA modification GTPase TrmE, related n=1 Tax=Neospora caninum (strain Liverpool) TaxID=572307 RepID=F0VF09_NEOCL|nr:tRNA modification GTPase TrmE, related [Neospora caninum Liverpool]CBZ52303.1 tRNA modification GTPase TrmE, related [Neospora caninum Liverpool]|eukprot:XP_003882335.1 tRNA modification GTPase TrmE, related [Neospora caninum Liverpool]